MPIVQAVGTAFSVSMSPEIRQRLEDACTAAILECQARGVIDPDEIREAVLAARDAVLRTRDGE
jgi:hypothetical protein